MHARTVDTNTHSTGILSQHNYTRNFAAQLLNYFAKFVSVYDKQCRYRTIEIVGKEVSSDNVSAKIVSDINAPG